MYLYKLEDKLVLLLILDSGANVTFDFQTSFSLITTIPDLAMSEHTGRTTIRGPQKATLIFDVGVLPALTQQEIANAANLGTYRETLLSLPAGTTTVDSTSILPLLQAAIDKETEYETKTSPIIADGPAKAVRK